MKKYAMNGIHKKTGKKIRCKTKKFVRRYPNGEVYKGRLMDCENCANNKNCAMPEIKSKALQGFNKCVRALFA